jgi:glycosyltransferase involved in cell wall biosynthesis
MTDLAVIMSVYQNDRLKYLKESVQSILNQTFSQFDYYIVFDGPVASDIDNYITTIGDTRIKLFRLGKNGGLARALNYILGIILKNPEYNLIARMDADDISLPERFEKQYKFLSENREIACVGCWYQEIDESGKHLADRKLPVDHDSLKKRYFTRTPFAHPSVMYRRQLIEKSGFYPTDTVLMEDNVLWGKALKQGLRFANIPEYLFKFRKDLMFYKRRSGIKYGWNFIITRFKINNTLRFPFSQYLVSLSIGIIKMLPAFIVRIFYFQKEDMQSETKI